MGAGPFHSRDSKGPSWGAKAISPSDNDDLQYWMRGVYVGGAGDLKVTMFDGSTVTFESVPAGSVLPIYIKKIHSTGTTATKIVGLI
jgi:hypothetical protein